MEINVLWVTEYLEGVIQLGIHKCFVPVTTTFSTRPPIRSTSTNYPKLSIVTKITSAIFNSTTYIMERNSTDHNTFPFLELPKELRDMIYDEALDDKEDQRLSRDLFLKARSVPRTNLLLASKQVKQEYEERAAKHSQLIIKAIENHDTYDNSNNGDDDVDESIYNQVPILPPAANRVPIITLEPYVADLNWPREASLDLLIPLIGMITSASFSLTALNIRVIMMLTTSRRLQPWNFVNDTVHDWIRELERLEWTDVPKLRNFQILDTGRGFYHAMEGDERTANVIAE